MLSDFKWLYINKPSLTHQTEFRLWLSSNWLISRI